jgi:hypothetical protein
LLAVAGVTVASAAYPPMPAPPPDAEGPRLVSQSSPEAAPGSPMDEPLRLIALAGQGYQNVRDYHCLFIKQEQIGGRLQPENSMAMYVRCQPFSVYFVWQSPASVAGQEVCYVAGRNGGNMRVRPRGLLGAVGFVNLDPNDPRARQTSRHPITEAGIGALINQLAAGWPRERQWGVTQVRVAEYKFDNRLCTRVETTHPASRDGRFMHYRDVVYFDKETHLPIRFEAYDWLQRAGDGGAVLEMYSYVSLRLNVGLRDEVFNK